MEKITLELTDHEIQKLFDMLLGEIAVKETQIIGLQQIIEHKRTEAAALAKELHVLKGGAADEH